MGLVLLNGFRSKRKNKKNWNIENKDKLKKITLRGQRNVRYHDRILSNIKKSYTLKLTYFCVLFCVNFV